MSFTRLVTYSVVPALLIAYGLAEYDGGIFAIAGGIAEAFVLARFFDRKKKT